MKRGELKRGITTGTCAALASKAAAYMALSGRARHTEELTIPAGDRIRAEILDIKIGDRRASCAVKKYAGSDPDVTDGIMIYSEVALTEKSGVKTDGGAGVGRVTKPGLQRPVGSAAINRVPLAMIESAVGEELEKYGADCGVRVIISVPEGEEAAKRTFNPRLGIEGGISILGTSGAVEPMSERALIDTIETELRFKKANGAEYALITPGNYGVDFIRNELKIDIDKAVKCGNFIGEAIDLCDEIGFKGMLLVGHIGKLVKTAAGIMNTHSRNADARMEIFIANAALCRAPYEALEKISECVSADEAVVILKEYGVLEKTMARIMRRVDFHIKNRSHCGLLSGAVVFSERHGVLGMTDEAKELIRRIGGAGA